MEVGGPALEYISLEGRQTICGLAMFTGAVTAVMNPDALSMAYTDPRNRIRVAPETSDPDANYAAVHTIDLTDLEPIIVLPPTMTFRAVSPSSAVCASNQSLRACCPAASCPSNRK